MPIKNHIRNLNIPVEDTKFYIDIFDNVPNLKYDLTVDKMCVKNYVVLPISS